MKRLKLEDQERIIILVLISVFLVLISLSLADLAPFTLANEDLDNARGVLEGVGVEGLSAIFAIVISLTLMAVQFASQQYTHRIMDLHIKSLIFWSVVVIYLGSLLYNIFMLGRLSEPIEGRYIEVSMLLTTLCFIMLIPYFFITMVRLRPETVISNLLSKLDEQYLNSIKELLTEGERRIPSEADKLLPITEIIERSIGTGDRGSARFGIEEIFTCYMAYLSTENEVYVSPYFLGHILGVGREAIIEADDDSMVHVLAIFGKAGTHAITQKMDFTTKLVLENISIIGFKVLKDYDVATQQMIDSLQSMLRAQMSVQESSDELRARIFTLCQDAADALITLEKYRLVKYLVNSFAELIDIMVETKHYDEIERTGELLEGVGVHAVNLGLRDIIHQSVHLLHRIGISSAKNKLVWYTPQAPVNIAERMIDHLLKIEGNTLRYRAKSKEYDTMINEIEYARRDIEKYLEKKTDFSDLWR